MHDGSGVSITTPILLGVTMQGVNMTTGNFADRFFWARQRAGMGAPTIAEKVGCGQALISNIEAREGAKSSRFNDEFAKLFDVDPNWLRSGLGKAPEGFNATEAHKMRRGGFLPGKVVSIRSGGTPRWATGENTNVLEGASDEERAGELQKRLFADFQDYGRLVGPERAKAFVSILTNLTALMQSTKETNRDRE